MIPVARPQLGTLEKYRVLEVIGSGQLTAGQEVRAFETAFARFCGSENAVATSNGTTALHAALAACGIGEGDRVVTTPFSFVASANAIQHCGATPVFADIDPETYTLDPDAVERVVEAYDGNVEAVLAVHLYGLPAEMDRLAAIADEYDLALIEDAAQAHGASFDGDRVGSLGDAAAFSFYPTKNMTTGEGGMVVTDRDDVAARAAQFVDHGRTEPGAYEHESVGYNYRMTDLAAAIGRIQLDRLPGFNEVRRRNASRLTAALRTTDVSPPVEPSDRHHVYHQYTVRTDDRERFRSYLEAEGVESAVYYPTVIYDQPAYDGHDAECPVAERAAREVVSLPVHPGLQDEEVDRIGEVVREFQSHV